MGQSRLAVVIATRDRREIARGLIRRLAAQTRPPDRVLISVADRADAPEAPGAEIVIGPPGLAAQRNTALRALAGAADLIVFYDDDFVPAPCALARIEAFFASHPDVAGATGEVIADGIGGEEISESSADRGAENWSLAPPTVTRRPTIGFYGCNMAIRAVAAEGLWFDEALPLYGWQEDLDYGARLAKRGAMVWTNAFAGVHRGVSSARPREAGLGYAQIANPAYLMRRRDIPRWYLLRLMAKNVAANAVGLARRDPRADRAGRLKGNALAVADLARGRLSPDRILSL